MPDMNDTRAEWARIALKTFMDETGVDETLSAISDLIVDLCHLTEREGGEPGALVAGAYSVFLAEKVEPDGLAPEPPVTIVVGEAVEG